MRVGCVSVALDRFDQELSVAEQWLGELAAEFQDSAG